MPIRTHPSPWRTTIRRDLGRTNSLRLLHFEPLEARLVLRADLVISELLASNLDGHLDFFETDSDWFEIHNRGSSRAFLNGWHVTDNWDNLSKWQFPPGTVIEPDQRLVVYASERDVVTSNGELHTNFKLDTDGDALALVDPGDIVIDGFSPTFPPQATNVSYGIHENLQATPLIGPGTTAQALVPSDSSPGNGWTGDQEPFDDTTWTSGTTGVGYETGEVGSTIEAPFAYWTFDELVHGATVVPDQQGHYDGAVVGATLTSNSGGRFGEALAFDGDNDFVNVGVVSELVNPDAFSMSIWFRRTVDHAGAASATNHTVNNVLIGHASPVSNDTLEIGTENDFIEVYLDTDELGGGIPPIRQQAAIQNDTWHHLVFTYDSNDPLETKIYLDGALVQEFSEYGGLVSDSGVSPLAIGLSRPESNTWGDFEGLIDDVAIWEAALDGAQVAALFSGNSPLLLSGYEPYIGLDLTAEMFQQNSSAYLRVPFTVSDPSAVDMLQLGMHYDDAFVAYVNGTEVARSNFSSAPTWNSTADSDRPDSAAIVAEDFFIPVVFGLLQAGENILAIQILNESTSATRSLTSPVLHAFELPNRNVIFLDGEAAGTALVPSDGTLGTRWTGGTEPFDDSDWVGGTTGTGYDLATEDTPLSPAEIATVLGGPAPLAYWTFDELTQSGSVAPDQQGNYDGTVVGAVVTSNQAGRFGAALSLDGENDYLSAGLIPELVNSAAFSLSVWFQREVNHVGSTGQTSHSVNNILIANSSPTDNDTLEIGTEDGFIEFYLDTDELGGAIPAVREQAGVKNNTWHHLVFTYDSQQDQETKIYLDGALVSEYSEYGGLISATSNPLTIGLARPDTSQFGDFEGLIDDVAIWDAALSSEQVAALFPISAPLAYWTFDELSAKGSMVTDAQGNYDGTVIGATVTTDGQGRFGEALVFDGEDDSVSAGVVTELVRPSAFSTSIWFQRTADHSGTSADTNHQVNNVLIAHSSNVSNDTLEIGTEEDFIEIYLDTEKLGGSIAPTRVPAGVQNGVWHHLVVTYDSLETEELKIYLDGSFVSAQSDYGGWIADSGVSPLSIGAARPNSTSLGDFEGLIDEVAFWEAALNSEQVAALFAGTSPPIVTGTGYSAHVGIDLEDELYHQSQSAYLRLPFYVNDPTAILALDLEMKYDDGFVAYINGTEVARSNLTGVPAWNSAADTERADRNGFQAEHFVISNPSELLQAGNNLFAVHGVNAATDATRFLILPKLSATMKPGEHLSFMETPTPGEVNAEGFIGFVPPPLFSIPGGTFSDEIMVELSNSLPGTEFRYTTNRNLPTASSEIYTGPITVNTTTQIRVIAFHPKYIASEIIGDTYILLDNDLLDFSSDLPILVMENFGQGAPHDRTFRKGFLALYEPTPTGRSQFTNPANLTSRIGIHRRGNSTFENIKTNWRIEFRDEHDNDRDISVLGMPADSDFTLHAPYDIDRALIRNAFSYELSRQAGHWAPRTRFVEVYANTNSGILDKYDYAGVYVLTEQIKISKDRVDIEKLTVVDNEPPNVTGGYIYKFNSSRVPGGEFSTSHNVFAYHEPGADEITNAQRNHLRSYISSFETALYGSNFKDPDQGYKSFIDVAAFVDEHMLRILTFEPDFFHASTFFHMDRGGLLRMTPIWDFNRALGSDVDLRSANPLTFDDLFHRNYFQRLFQDHDFSQAWVDRWWELRSEVYTEANFGKIIDGMAAELAEAQVRNFEKWRGVTPNGGSYATSGPTGWSAEISHMKGWLAKRLTWLDSQMLAPVSFNKQNTVVAADFEAALSASEGTIYYTLDGSDPRAPGGNPSPQAIAYAGEPIVISETTRIVARTHSSANSFYNLKRWSSPSTSDLVVSNGLILSEFQYNPHGADTALGELDADNDAFEFIELSNTGNAPVDLGGLQFVQRDVDGDQQGIDFDFASQTLDPEEQIVIVNNRAAFESRYGTAPRIADGDDGKGGNNGEFGGQLSNGGELITLLLPSEISLVSFDYGDSGDWPRRADGDGSSLEPVDPSMDLNDPSNWRPSVAHGGTPGSPTIEPVNSVVINEVLTNTSEPANDMIEFFNPTDHTIDIGGLWLSDSMNNLNRYVIPNNTIISSESYLALHQNDFSFGLSSNGEDVVLVQPGENGNPDLFVDHVSFGPALPNEAFGFWPDATGYLYPMISATLGTANSGPRVGPVVINEIMYNPTDLANTFDPELLEFVEIYNPSPRTVDLSHWTLDGIGYEFPEEATIGAGQSLILVPFNPATITISDAFNSAYDVNIAARLSDYLGPYPGRANNAGETLTLRRPVDTENPSTRVIEDQVNYNEMAPWPTTPDGTGLSLKRKRVDLWGNDPDSWEGGIPTPGQMGRNIQVFSEKSTTVIGEVGKIDDLTHEPQTITLTHAYTNPVVFAQPASFNGNDPVVVRVNAVQSNQFDLFLAEPSNLNGLHNGGETVSYVVLEAGNHWLADGTHLEVGTVDTNATVGVNIPVSTWESIQFTSLFFEDPVVFSQIQTTSGEVFLSTRQRPATTGMFDVALEPEEQFDLEHGVETIGYLAIESGSHTWNEMPVFAETRSFISTSFRYLTFYETTFDVLPVFLASMASYHGVDNSHLRFQNLELGRVSVKIEEDTTLDEEMSHTLEDVSYLAIGGEAPLTAVTRFFSDGQTRMFPFDVTTTGHILDLNVHLDLIHTNVTDLDISLESPDGKVVELMNNTGANGDNLTGTIFDDEAAEPIASGTAPFTGKFQPSGTLRDFAGTQIAGTWTLIVADDALNRSIGALLDWSMQIELAPEPEGNLNYDSHLDAADIDLLFANFGSSDAIYDLNADGKIDQQDVDQLVQNVMGKRYGDANIDQDVDKDDFNSVAMNYDPRGSEPLHKWGDGNFDGDEDVDFTDAMRVVSNFDPSGYQRVTSLSTADALIVSSLIVGENGNRIHNAGKLESSHLGDNRPKIDGDNTTPEPQSQSEEITTKSSSGNQLSYLENVDRSFRRMGIHQGQLPLRTQSRHFGIDPNDGD